ncbi:MAG: hypothetical protein KGS45_08925 [Planctomycetes bacterium]|nr:hypothetical protein [Planctomycetota bacterium]
MRTRRVVGMLALVAAAVVAGGCSSNSKSEELAREYHWNLSPELATLHERPIDIENRMSITTDENLRMLTEDWGRLWLMERQSRLSPRPVTR